MVSDLEELFDVRRLSSAERGQIFEAAGMVASAASDTQLLAHLARASAHEASLREMQRQWALASTSKAKYVPEMSELDGRVDRQHTSIGAMLESHIKGEDPDPEIRNKAQEVRDAIYPTGVAAVTRLPYLQQDTANQDIVKKLQTTYSAQVAALGLTSKAAALASLTAAYSDAVRRSPAAIESSTVDTAEDRAHLYMLEVMVRVLGNHFDSDNPAHMAARTQVTSRLFELLGDARARKRARRAANRRRKNKEQAAAESADSNADSSASPDSTPDSSPGSTPDSAPGSNSPS